MKNRKVRACKNIDKSERKPNNNFTIEEILKAELSHSGAIFMLFILVLLVGSIFLKEEVLWIMALVLFIQMTNHWKQ